MRRRNLLVVSLVAVVAVAAAVVAWLRLAPVGDDAMRRSVVMVEQQWCNAVVIDGRERMFFVSSRGDTALAGVTVHRDTALHRRLVSGLWLAKGTLVPLCRGRVVTVQARPEPLPSVRGDSAVVRLCRSSLAAALKVLRSQRAETRYYLRSHGVQDNGYQPIAALATRIDRDCDGAERALRLVDSLAADRTRRHTFALRQTVRYVALLRTPDRRMRRTPLQRADHMADPRLVMLRTADGSMPGDASPVAAWPFGAKGCDLRAVGFPGLGCDGLQCDTVSSAIVQGRFVSKGVHDLPPLLAADGSPVFSARGHLLGIVAGRAVVPLLASFGDVPRNARDAAHHSRKAYRGGMRAGRYDGYGTLAIGDSVVYAGQWRAGRRWGRGVSHDSLHHRIVGTWRADTLVGGSWTDSTGTYHGQLNRDGIANGHGVFVDWRSDLYVGQWRGGERTGFGFALTRGRHMRVGEWHADRYLGERLEYTADRIYGIDISRFQHDVGRRHYPIDWGRVRISGLGTISRKKITGRVDYPVSFCYVKSTEGTTLRNRYYAADSRAARAHGIRVGAYHFFSTRTPAAQQAQFFLRCSSFHKGDLPPVLDVEPTHAQIHAMGGAAALFRAVRTWLRIVGAHTGTKPVLYISQTFVNRYLPSAPDLKRDYNIWIARYGEYKPDVHLVYWQLCPDGRVSGIRPAVDINVFNGYRAEFESFLSRECVK